MKRAKTITGIVLATLIAGGGYVAWYKSDVEEAKRVVRQSLNDPSSAEFTSYEECGTASDGRVLKGKVNFRNEQGGMQGETTFIVRAYGVLPYAKVASAAHKYPNIADAFDEVSIGLPIGTPCSKIFAAAEQRMDDQAKARQEASELEPMAASVPSLENMQIPEL
ncbi:hypothetical protein [Sphingomonas endophytica]|uniref:hypothetical protein n=1 Tax=Sphingomonas endophytica TaxID=869719 RepID=UPI00128EB013|nr:hypothetical protein [Sphingomonas endophytica]